mgnify:CR=1 FL=1
MIKLFQETVICNYSLMINIKRYNIYEHLRDFGVPSSVLDTVFDNETDTQILIDAWQALMSDGISEDEASKYISELIFKELEIKPYQSIEDEK